MTDIKSCPKCNFVQENTSHLLFHCPAYADPRAVLMDNLSTRLPQNILRNETRLEKILLFGSHDIELNTNILIFADVIRFLTATGRFVKPPTANP